MLAASDVSKLRQAVGEDTVALIHANVEQWPAPHGPNGTAARSVVGNNGVEPGVETVRV